MRKLLIAILLLLPLMMVAQQRVPQTFEQLRQKYISHDGFTMVSITSEMLKSSGRENFADVRDIRIVKSDSYDPEFVREMSRVTYQTGFMPLATVEKKGQNIWFYYRATKNERVSDLVMVSWGEKNNLIMYIRGDFSIAQIRDMADKMSSRQEK